jgi:hypothetical protein
MSNEGTVFKAVGRVNQLSVMTIDAYGVAVKNGFEGTVEEWLASLHASDEQVKSAVETYLENHQIGGGYLAQDTAPEDTSVLWVDLSDNSDDGFQDAINTALEQAKASGEFDGKDGQPGRDGVDGAAGKDGKDGQDYVLTPADKTEIAEIAAGLVEVPESSGGISVAGATVGQTVKIAEVDENGVPTAWEPVDFPNDGEPRFEVVAEFEITEEVNKYTVNCPGHKYKTLYFDGLIRGTVNNTSNGKAFINFNYDSYMWNDGHSVYLGTSSDAILNNDNRRFVWAVFHLNDIFGVYMTNTFTSNSTMLKTILDLNINTEINSITLTSQNGQNVLGIGTYLLVVGELV